MQEAVNRKMKIVEDNGSFEKFVAGVIAFKNAS